MRIPNTLLMLLAVVFLGCQNDCLYDCLSVQPRKRSRTYQEVPEVLPNTCVTKRLPKDGRDWVRLKVQVTRDLNIERQGRPHYLAEAKVLRILENPKGLLLAGSVQLSMKVVDPEDPTGLPDEDSIIGEGYTLLVLGEYIACPRSRAKNARGICLPVIHFTHGRGKGCVGIGNHAYH